MIILSNPFHNEFNSALMYVYFPVCITCAYLNVLDWEGYLAAIENIIKYFFAHDLLNYARLMPVHLAQMNALENMGSSKVRRFYSD